MEKSYDPKTIEFKWREKYLAENIGEPKGNGSSYCIMIPPPNVTGTLHMGHGFQLSLMDTMTRYQRMQGKKTLWQMGTDHAGIATQMVVERKLAASNQTKESLGRDKFIEKIWDWKHESGDKIKTQIKRMGASVDWSSEKFTLDESLSTAVSHAFIKLYKDGLIYRGSRLVNWDPVLKTAVSDLEVISEEVQGTLWSIKYPVVGTDEFVTVATTRPETMFGDTAIAIAPNDTRYKHLIGTKIQLPFTEHQIPVVEDEHVDPEFGTGCVKVTPAHDFNDYEIGKRHNLTMRNIFNSDASLNDNVPKEFKNIDRFAARKLVLEKLKEAGLLVKEQTHKMVVPKGDRSGSIIEPYLTKQWFVATKDLAAPAIDVVKTGKLKFYPENWENTYFSWLENIEDWCISRQLWWGHRIPAWYDTDENIYVGESIAAIKEHYKLADDVVLRQDDDVLDTWFSSALWPFATLGWPEKTNRMQDFFPTDLLVTGFDIIFFWVARMVMFSLKFTGEVPFKDVYITGLIRDHAGHKMSKSKGNILDPIDLIDGASIDDLISSRTASLMQPEMKSKVIKATKKEYPQGIEANGTDALRFTFAALATPGRDIRFDSNRLTGYRNFCNKIWNATRYIMMNVDTPPVKPETIDHPINIYLAGQMHKAITTAEQNLATYRFDLFAQTLYDLIWNQYCDWYLELTKPLLKSGDPKTATETKYILIQSLETILRIAHPLIPFITEEIWQQIQPLAKVKPGLLTNSAYPQASSWQQNSVVDKEIHILKQLITGVRTIKAEMNIAPNKRVPIIVVANNKDELDLVFKHEVIFTDLAKLESISTKNASDTIPASATYLVGKIEIHIPLAGLIDKDAELARLNKAICKLEKSLQAISGRLANTNYINNAPQEIVEKEQSLKIQQSQELEKLKQQQLSLAQT